MTTAYYIIVYESENIFAFNKLANVLYADNWEQVNKFLRENLARYREGMFDSFWYRLGKKVGIELEYDDGSNIVEETYEKIMKKVDGTMDLVEMMNCGEPKKSEFIIETMIVSENDVLFGILQEQGYLRLTLEEMYEKKEEKENMGKRWWIW